MPKTSASVAFAESPTGHRLPFALAFAGATIVAFLFAISPADSTRALLACVTCKPVPSSTNYDVLYDERSIPASPRGGPGWPRPAKPKRALWLEDGPPPSATHRGDGSLHRM